VSNSAVISWREQATFQRYNGVHFILDQRLSVAFL
jgi:hypothetical protein